MDRNTYERKKVLQQYSWILSEETHIHITKMTVIKIVLYEIHKRKNKIWVIYIDSESSMHSIEYKKKNHLILNYIYNILPEFQN